MEYEEATDEAEGSGTQHAATDETDKTEQRSQAETYRAADSGHIVTTSDGEDNTT